MTERYRSGSFANPTTTTAKMNDLTPRKTMLIVVIVVGCFAVLWPKVFYPMLVGPVNQPLKPLPIDKSTGCCDVISETDVNTIKIMSELCKTIIIKEEDVPLTGKEIVSKCQSAVLDTCGIDISEVLQQQVKLGQSVKQILDEIRSLNGSLCLKYNFGVSPWQLGVPHRVNVKMSPSTVRQERPLQLRSELIHPAFRERGRAIPQPQTTTPRATVRVVEGRPGPVPGMRPTLGGAGHVVPPPKQGTGSMGLIMPIYTIGIVVFFTYTVLKIIFKKQPESLYPPVEPDPNFRREVFESESIRPTSKLTREGVSSKLVVNAMSALLDEVDQEIETRHSASEFVDQNIVANGAVPKEEQSSVKVLGMEMTASCEGGKKWSRPTSPVLQTNLPPQEPPEPPQEIFLEGALPPQSHLLVADSATEAEKISSEDDPAVVLAGKMTLSVISLESTENGTGPQTIDYIQEVSTNDENIVAPPVEETFKESFVDVTPSFSNQKVITSNANDQASNLLQNTVNELVLNDSKLELTINNDFITREQAQLEASVDDLYNKEERDVEDEEKELDTQSSNVELIEAAENSEPVSSDKVVEPLIADNVSEHLTSEVSVTDEQLTATTTEPLALNSLDEMEKLLESIRNSEVIQSEIETDTAIEILDPLIKREVSESESTEKLQSQQEITDEPLGASTIATEPLPASDIEPTEKLLESIQNFETKTDTAIKNVDPSITSDSSVTEQFLVSESVPVEKLETPQNSQSDEQLKSTTITTEPSPVSNLEETEQLLESIRNSDQIETVDPPITNDGTISELLISESVPVEKLQSSQVFEPDERKTTTTTTETSPNLESIENLLESSRNIEEIASDTSDPTLNKPIEHGSGEHSKDESTDSSSHDTIIQSATVPENNNIISEEKSNESEPIQDVIEAPDEEPLGDEYDEVASNDLRLEGLEADVIERVNGESQDYSKYSISAATLAENDISDEEDIEDEDDDDLIVEEIIEYVTDEEEELEDLVEPQKNTNHLP